jgi:hypothetical protein
MEQLTKFRKEIQLKQSDLLSKMRPLNGSLRREISALRAKPNPDESQTKRLEELKGLSSALHEAKKQRFQQRTCQLLKRLNTLTEELDNLDEKIDMDVSIIHNSIFSNGVFPENTSNRLPALFEKWQATLTGIDECINELETIKDTLDRYVALCDTILVKPEAPPVSKKPGKTELPQMKFDFSSSCAKDLLELHTLLIDIIDFYIIKCGQKHKLQACCSRVAAYRLLGESPPESIQKHKKKEIRAIIRGIRGQIKSPHQDTKKEIFLLKMALDAFYGSKQLLSQQALSDEYVQAQLRYYFLRKNSGIWLAMFNSMETMRILKSIFSQISGVLRNEQGQAVSSSLAQVFSDDFKNMGDEISKFEHRFFLLSLFQIYLEETNISILCTDVERQVADETKAGNIAFLRKLAQSALPRIWRRDDVELTLAKFGLIDLIAIVPPINFVFEHGIVQNSPPLTPEALMKSLKALTGIS